MLRFHFPATVTPARNFEAKDAGFVVSFPDFPEAHTQGDTLSEALAAAADCLEEALAGRIKRRGDIPSASPARGRPLISPGALIAAKTALYVTMRGARVSNVALAKRLGVRESEVRRMLDPRHPTKIGRLEEALAALGKRLSIAMEEAA
jgi:antitoxin HicB